MVHLIPNGHVGEVPGLRSAHGCALCSPFRVCRSSDELNRVQGILHFRALVAAPQQLSGQASLGAPLSRGYLSTPPGTASMISRHY